MCVPPDGLTLIPFNLTFPSLSSETFEINETVTQDYIDAQDAQWGAVDINVEFVPADTEGIVAVTQVITAAPPSVSSGGGGGGAE